MTDLLNAYAAACDRYELAERAVAQAADERGRVVARMAYAGMSLADIGAAVGVASRGRVHELVKRGRAALARDAGPCAAIAAQTVDVDPTTLAAARSMLADLRARLRREASAVAALHRDILADADALRIWWPRQGRPGEHLRGGEQDWLRGLDPAERQRLRGWRADTAAYSVDNLATRLRDAHPAIDDDGMTDDQIVAEVWLHHSRVIDAAGAVARGRVPRSVRYSSASCAHPDRMGLPIDDDGYRPSLLLADDDTAAHHIAEVLADRESLEAEQCLSRCELGPAPWIMTSYSYVDEVACLLADLAGGYDVDHARRRLGELRPFGTRGDDWADHAELVRLAGTAGYQIAA